jgi:hypothetical protein
MSSNCEMPVFTLPFLQGGRKARMGVLFCLNPLLSILAIQVVTDYREIL